MEYISKVFKHLTGNTVEVLLESIDDNIDALIRKPRREIVVHQSPAGCQLRDVKVEEMIGVGFYVNPGQLKRFTFVTPADVKNLKISIIRSKGSETSTKVVDLTGTTLLTESIAIEANTEVFFKLSHPTDLTVAFLTAGFVFEPKGV